MFILDAHLDLSMNALEWNRDLTRPIAEIRSREEGLTDKPDRGHGVVSLPALREGNIGIVVATLIARYVAPGSKMKGWHSPEQAWAQTQGQLAWYQAMESAGHMRQLRDMNSFNQHFEDWTNATADENKPIGFVLSLEGADSLVTVDHLETAWQYGLRAVGPAHYGPGRYANGTDATGKMNSEGIALLRRMDELKMILDATHLCDDAFFQAMDNFAGPIWASHNNCRALVNHNRQFSDEQLRILIDRGAVIGAAMDAWMIVPGWKRGTSTPSNMNCTLNRLIDHIDHICQLAGNTLHVGVGSDLDGAFGKEQCPLEIDSISDLQKLIGLLQQRGYNTADVENIMHGNFMRFIKKAWS